MKRLIVNADDFGYNAGVNRGIARAARAGALSSTTLMAPAAEFEAAAAMAADLGGAGVGCHLCLVGTPPVSPPGSIPSLVGRDGKLLPSLDAFGARYARGGIAAADVRREVGAQLEKLLRAGVTPTHVDAHKHSFVLPGIHAAVCAACREYGIRAMRNPFDVDPCRPSLAGAGGGLRFTRQWLVGRAVRVFRAGFRRRCRAAGIRVPERFFGVAFTGMWSERYVEHVFSALPEGTSELMVHPAEMDESMRACSSRLRESRGVEFELLLGAVKTLLDGRGVELVSFATLAAMGE